MRVCYFPDFETQANVKKNALHLIVTGGSADKHGFWKPMYTRTFR